MIQSKTTSNKIWLIKIRNANKYYQQWEERFKCRKLEEYWEGYQWRNIIDIPYYRPYVVNLIYAELKKKLSNILYQNLEYNLTPRPGHYSYNPEFAMQSAQKKQDFLNEMISRANLDNDFNDSCELVAMDSYFRYGIMEIDYAADWRNPAKPPLITTAHENDDINENKIKIIEDEEVPENERIYFKRIKASRFRVSTSDDTKLGNCSWCGYYSFMYKDVLLNTKELNLPKDFDSLDAGITSEYIGAKFSMASNKASTDNKDMLEMLKAGKVSKVWNVWDNEINDRLLLLEPNFDIIWRGEFEHLPFATHRHDLRLDGWYPVPPIYHWIAPQDEINQAREQMRNYRRRFTRKFKYFGIDQEELEKFKNETDGEIIKMKTPNSFIDAIGNPEIGISIIDGLNASRDDFNIVSGSSSDLTTAQADRTSATQSKITAMKAQVIENLEQIKFTKFYKKVGRLVLLNAQENFAGGIWVKDSVNPGEQFLGQTQAYLGPVFRYITTQDLSDGFDVDIEINCVDGSPQKMQEEFEKFIKFLTTVMQFPQISLSPLLIREAAYRIGYRNEKIITEMQRTAALQMMGQAQQMAQQQGVNLNNLMNNASNGAEGNMVRNAAPSSQEVIDQQLMG